MVPTELEEHTPHILTKGLHKVKFELKSTRHGLQDNSGDKFSLRGSIENNTRQSSSAFSTRQEAKISHGNTLELLN